MKNSQLQIIPIGGVGDFGANATVFRTATTTILVDFGLMFPPDTRQPGVDYYVPDCAALLREFPDLDAIFVTHGHEDHIGALPFLLRHQNLPIHTMPYTARLIRQKCRDLNPKINHVALNQPIRCGDIQVEFIGVTHSIIQACALAISGAGQTVIHSGDFKVDALPGDGYPFQWDRFEQLGDQGVDLLIMDSTNAHRPGFCPSDAEIVDAIEDHIQKAKGRVFFTTFSSHMPRLRKLNAIAKASGRKIVLLGKSFTKHYEAGLESAYLEHPSDTFITSEEAESLPEDQLIFVVTGSQGERSSVLVKLSREAFQGLALKAGDTVIFSSKTIPGNERVIALLISDLERKGIDVVTARRASVHTSGHGYREDAAFLFNLTRPKHVIPIHGEFNFLLNHFRWLQGLIRSPQQVHMIQNGDIAELKGGRLTLSGTIQIPLVPIDGNQDCELAGHIIRERKDMMYSGLIAINVLTHPKSSVEVETHGLAEQHPGTIASSLTKTLEPLVRQHLKGDLQKIVKRETRRFLKTCFFGRPLIKIAVDGRFKRSGG